MSVSNTRLRHRPENVICGGDACARSVVFGLCVALGARHRCALGLRPRGNYHDMHFGRAVGALAWGTHSMHALHGSHSIRWLWSPTARGLGTRSGCALRARIPGTKQSRGARLCASMCAPGAFFCGRLTGEVLGGPEALGKMSTPSPPRRKAAVAPVLVRIQALSESGQIFRRHPRRSGLRPCCTRPPFSTPFRKGARGRPPMRRTVVA